MTRLNPRTGDPKRIQRKRTKGWRMPEGAVYVGRPSRWGNGYRVGDVDLGIGRLQTASDAVECYRAEIVGWNHDYRTRWLAPLRGHDLACWCPEECGLPVDLGWGPFGGPWDPCTLPTGHAGHHDPSAGPYCHADVLLELANA